MPTPPPRRGVIAKFSDWGPSYWQMAHSATFVYAEAPDADDKARITAFFTLFPYLLPCAVCAVHYVDTVRDQFPLTDDILASKDTLTRWLVDIHNSVNRRTGKGEVAYEEVLRYYTVDSSFPMQSKGGLLASAAAGGDSDPQQPYQIAVGVLAGLLVLAMIALAVLVARSRQGQHAKQGRFL